MYIYFKLQKNVQDCDSVEYVLRRDILRVDPEAECHGTELAGMVGRRYFSVPGDRYGLWTVPY